MVIVDTTVWIDYLNGVQSPQTDWLDAQVDKQRLGLTELLRAMTYGKPLPHNKAIPYLRKGMQKVRIELLAADGSLQQWICSHEFERETPFKLIWERGFDWQTALREAETKPAEWRIEVEQRNKYLQERVRQIRDEQGLSATKEWMLKQKSGNASENT